MKRYAIVRVDNMCPDEFENIKIDYICRNISCYQGKECSKKFYGDTKEQMVRKIAQVLFKEELGWYKNHIGFIPLACLILPFRRSLACSAGS